MVLSGLARSVGFPMLIEEYGVGALGDDIGENQDADKERHHKIEKVEEGLSLLSAHPAFGGRDVIHVALSSAPQEAASGNR